MTIRRKVDFDSRGSMKMILTFVLCGMLMHVAVESYGNDLTMIENKMHSENKKWHSGMIVKIKKNGVFKFSGSVVTNNFALAVADYVDDINSNVDLYEIEFGIHDSRAIVCVKAAFKHKEYLKHDAEDAITRSYSSSNAGLIQVTDESAFSRELKLQNCYDRPVASDRDVIVEGLVGTDDRIKIGIIEARVMDKDECMDKYKKIDFDHSLTCLDISKSKGKLDATDLGVPVFIPNCVSAIGIVSRIPEENQEGEPILMTDLIHITQFIKEKTGFKMYMYGCDT